jgi:hypothetical protein
MGSASISHRVIIGVHYRSHAASWAYIVAHFGHVLFQVLPQVSGFRWRNAGDTLMACQVTLVTVSSRCLEDLLFTAILRAVIGYCWVFIASHLVLYSLSNRKIIFAWRRSLFTFLTQLSWTTKNSPAWLSNKKLLIVEEYIIKHLTPKTKMNNI